MSTSRRIRTSLLILACAFCGTAAVSAIINTESALWTGVAVASCGALLGAFVDAYRRPDGFTRGMRLVVLLAPVPIALAIGPNALGLPMIGTLTLALADGRRPTALAAWFSGVSLVAIVAQPRADVVADLPVLPGYAFMLLLVAHLTTTLRRSIDERDDLHRRLVHQARHDQLTGLPNRTVLTERSAALVARREPHAVLMIDLDGFKHVNDTYGHAAGDRVLQEIAGRIDGCLRGSDLVVRFGGDEFVVLVEYCPERAVAEAVATRIADAVRRPIHLGEARVRISASVGVSFDEPTAERALSVADARMYAAKAA